MSELIKARENDTKTTKDGKDWIYRQVGGGKLGWRRILDGDKTPKKNNSKTKDPKTEKESKPLSKTEKLQKHLKSAPNEDLVKYATRDQNDPSLRKLAYDELVSRGEDVSNIDLNTGKFKQKNELFGNDSSSKKSKKVITEPEDFDDDGITETPDWKSEEFLKKNFDLKTKRGRIQADEFIYKNKIKDPNYEPPEEEITDLNAFYAQFFSTDTPFMIASGGAGVGKSYGLHAVAKFLGKKPFDETTDKPGDGDYDYVEVGEITSPVQLAQTLKEHNGKVIVFDDTDEVFKTAEAAGMIKKATATSGKRVIGKKSTGAGNVDPFEFTGQMILLTNMTDADFAKNVHLKAIHSRATLNKEIQFTKQEQLDMIEKLRHKMNITGVPRLPNKADDVKERDEVFEILKDNFRNIDPNKFTSRLFQGMLNQKRAIDGKNALIQDGDAEAELLFGKKKDWKQKVENFIMKGEVDADIDSFEKALEYFELN